MRSLKPWLYLFSTDDPHSLVVRDTHSQYYTLLILLTESKAYLSRAVPGRVAQSVGHVTRKSEVLGSIPGLATYFRFSFRFFKKGSCQLLAKVCAGLPLRRSKPAQEKCG